MRTHAFQLLCLLLAVGIIQAAAAPNLFKDLFSRSNSKEAAANKTKEAEVPKNKTASVLPAVLPPGPTPSSQSSQAKPAVLPIVPKPKESEVPKTKPADSPQLKSGESAATKPFLPTANSTNAANKQPEPAKLPTVNATSARSDVTKPKVDLILVKTTDDAAKANKNVQKPTQELVKPKEDLSKQKEPQSPALKDSIIPPVTKDTKPDFVARMFVNMARKDNSLFFNVSCLPPVSTATLEARQATGLPQQNAYIRSGKVHIKSEDGSVEAHLELAGGSIERATQEGNGVGPVLYLDDKTLRMNPSQTKPHGLFIRCNLVQYLCRQTPCTHETTGASRMDLQSKVFFVEFDKGITGFSASMVKEETSLQVYQGKDLPADLKLSEPTAPETLTNKDATEYVLLTKTDCPRVCKPNSNKVYRFGTSTQLVSLSKDREVVEESEGSCGRKFKFFSKPHLESKGKAVAVTKDNEFTCKAEKDNSAFSVHVTQEANFAVKLKSTPLVAEVKKPTGPLFSDFAKKPFKA